MGPISSRQRLFLLIMICSLFSLHAGEGAGDIVYVDADGYCAGHMPCMTAIQAGIDAAADGDTVFVYKGTYYENILVTRGVRLIGQERNQTIVDGRGSGDVIHVSADSISIRGFTIRNSGTYGMLQEWDSGLELDYCNHCEIRNCVFSGNTAGLCLYGSSFNIINNNSFWLNSKGIVFSENWHEETWPDNLSNEIIYNTIQDNYWNGICFEHTGLTYHRSNIVRGNNVSHNGLGLYMIMSHMNEVVYNEFSDNTDYGVYLFMCCGGGQYNTYHHNNFISNNADTVQALDTSGGVGIDYWYSQTEGQGNYWSDYSGPDANGDGIGDIPYDIAGDESQDLYPLIQPIDLSGDISPIQILGLPDTVEQGRSYQLGVSVQNYGPSFAGPMFVICTIDSIGRPVYRDTMEIAMLPGGSIDTVSFDEWAVHGESVEYEVIIETTCAGDLQPDNDTVAVPVFSSVPSRVPEGPPDESLPGRFVLHQNYPNPLNSHTSIEYYLPVDCLVRLDVFNVAGQRVATLEDGYQMAGSKVVCWDAGSCASGIYFYRLQAGQVVKMRRMVLLK
jgi:nitrous oxidase accessory protein